MTNTLTRPRFTDGGSKPPRPPHDDRDWNGWNDPLPIPALDTFMRMSLERKADTFHKYAIEQYNITLTDLDRLARDKQQSLADWLALTPLQYVQQSPFFTDDDAVNMTAGAVAEIERANKRMRAENTVEHHRDAIMHRAAEDRDLAVRWKTDPQFMCVRHALFVFYGEMLLSECPDTANAYMNACDLAEADDASRGVK